LDLRSLTGISTLWVYSRGWYEKIVAANPRRCHLRNSTLSLVYQRFEATEAHLEACGTMKKISPPQHPAVRHPEPLLLPKPNSGVHLMANFVTSPLQCSGSSGPFPTLFTLVKHSVNCITVTQSAIISSTGKGGRGLTI
jgi:hypothetical protein